MSRVDHITPDHLDRHGTMEHYAEVKATIFRHQTRAMLPSSASTIRIHRRSAPEFPRTDRRGCRLGGQGVGAWYFLCSTENFRRGRRDDTRRFATSRLCQACPARIIGRMWRWPCGNTITRQRSARQSPVRSRTFPGLAHRHRAVGAIGRVRFGQRFQGDKCRCSGEGARLLRQYLLDRPAGRRRRVGIAKSLVVLPRIRRAI